MDIAQRVARFAGTNTSDTGIAASRRSARQSNLSSYPDGAEVDQTAGLLTLREHQSFALFATGETLATLAANPIFGVLAAGVVTRQRIRPDRPFVLPGGLHAELFAVPGKVALYFEGKKLRTEPGINVGVELVCGAAVRLRTGRGWRDQDRA